MVSRLFGKLDAQRHLISGSDFWNDHFTVFVGQADAGRLHERTSFHRCFSPHCWWRTVIRPDRPVVPPAAGNTCGLRRVYRAQVLAKLFRVR